MFCPKCGQQSSDEVRFCPRCGLSLAGLPAYVAGNDFTLSRPDPAQSAESRVRMLDMLAANRIPLLAYHFAWPGLGHVAKAGEGFRYFPEPMRLTPS